MTISEALKEMEEYLDLCNLYGYKILTILEIKDETFLFHIEERCPNGDRLKYLLTVCDNGVIINDQGTDVLDLMIDCLEGDIDYIKSCKEFQNKWYQIKEA